MADQLDYALDLMRRLPPTNVENNLASLCDIAPHLIEDLLSSVDQPLKVAHDAETRRDYLLCDYNRDGDSYRYLHHLPITMIRGFLAFLHCISLCEFFCGVGNSLE